MNKNIATKINNWKQKLLDLGKKSKMINFKESKTSSLLINKPDADELFCGLMDMTAFEVTYAAAQAPLLENAKKQEEKTRKIGKMVCNLSESDAKKILYRLRAKGRTAIEEQGINLLHIAFGFLNWTEKGESEVMKSPLILVPVRISLDSIHTPYRISLYEEDAILNPTLKYKMKETFNIELPEFNFDGDESISSYLAKVKATLKVKGWGVVSDIYLGLFSFSKLNMYMDIDNNIEIVAKSPLVQGMCGVQNTIMGIDTSTEIDLDKEFSAKESYCVVDADSSQLEAIYHAVNGKSFVLQGPPGTGKSQTITNIIASCMANDKKVLFVSEKMAALEVVYNNLKRVGLEDFCLQLHSHNANKKDIINDLCETLIAPKTVVRESAMQDLADLQKKRDELNGYAQVLHANIPKLGCTLFSLFGLLSKYIEQRNILFSFPDISQVGKEELNAIVDILNEYVSYAKLIGYDYKENDFYGYIDTDNSFECRLKVEKLFDDINEKLSTMHRLSREICQALDIPCPQTFEKTLKYSELFEVISSLKPFNHHALSKDVINSLNANIGNLQFNINIYNEAFLTISKLEKDILAEDTKTMLKNFKYTYRGIFKGLNKNYRRDMHILRVNCVSLGKINNKKALNLLILIEKYKDSIAAINSSKDCFDEYLPNSFSGMNTDCKGIFEEIAKLEKCHAMLEGICGEKTKHSIASLSLQKDKSGILSVISQIASVEKLIASASELFDKKVIDYSRAQISEVLRKTLNCKKSMSSLSDWINFYELYKKLENNNLIAFIDKAIQEKISKEEIIGVFLKRFYYLWIDEVSKHEERLSGFSREKQDELVRLFCEKDKLQFKIAEARIREKLSSMRPDINMVSQNSEVSILLREGEKKRRQMPIRKLFLQLTTLISRIKPCLLMSPMSVSQFLQSSNDDFDTVIFDEASQIFPEDALGAIYRAKQLIVVGDSEQLPPTNFFNASVDNDFDSEEDDDEDVDMFESILDACNTFLNRIRLKWHYRSKNEELIAFSNKMIYKNQLISFPASSKAAKDSGVEFVHVPNGVYDRSGARCNKIEADRVVSLVFEHFDKYPDRTLGVVAFSEAQAECIDIAIAEYRKKHAKYEKFFNESQKENFFIKNIESVQGDERDTIIFSIGYGKDINGKIHMNFGPLSKEGGERRLNVATTRAKINIKLVSSILSTDIDDKNARQGVKFLKNYIEFALNGVKWLGENTHKNLDEEYDDSFEKDIASTLEKNGYIVDRNVGCSGYKIDMAIKNPDRQGEYILGIECDGNAYSKNRTARDRDRLKREVLERLNWNLYRIWSTDWIKRRDTEIKKLLLAAESALKNAAIQMPKLQNIVNTTTIKERGIENKVPTTQRVSPFKKYIPVDVQPLPQIKHEQKIKEIIKQEAPIHHELLLKKVCKLYGREKISPAVKEQFATDWVNCKKAGFEKKGDFYYSSVQTKINFRVPMEGDQPRKIEWIDIYELSLGVQQILKINVGMTKESLMSELCRTLGFKRATEQMRAYAEMAIENAIKLNLIEQKNDAFSAK